MCMQCNIVSTKKNHSMSYVESEALVELLEARIPRNTCTREEVNFEVRFKGS